MTFQSPGTLKHTEPVASVWGMVLSEQSAPGMATGYQQDTKNLGQRSTAQYDGAFCWPPGTSYPCSMTSTSAMGTWIQQSTKARWMSKKCITNLKGYPKDPRS